MTKKKTLLTLDVDGYQVPFEYLDARKMHQTTAWGQYNTKTMKAAVVKNHPGGAVGELDTLLHECIHVIDHLRKLRLKEDQVWQLGTSLANLLYRNPELRKYITKACR